MIEMAHPSQGCAFFKTLRKKGQAHLIFEMCVILWGLTPTVRKILTEIHAYVTVPISLCVQYLE